MRETAWPACEACEGEMDLCGAFTRHAVCFECVKARAATVGRMGRCACGRKARPRQVTTRVRSWTACDRCLGTIVKRRAKASA